MNAPVILPMRLADVMNVERVARAAAGFAWPRAELEAELERPYSCARVLRPGSGEPLCAFAIYWITGDEAQLLHLATAPAMQRRGYARALMLDVLAGATRRRAGYMVLEARVSNTAAQCLYESLGFARVGLRPGYYTDNGEDAVVMRRELGR